MSKGAMKGRKRKRGEGEGKGKKEVGWRQTGQWGICPSSNNWSLYCWGPPWSFHVKPHFLKRGKWDIIQYPFPLISHQSTLNLRHY